MVDHPLKGRKQTPEAIANRVASRKKNGTYKKTEEQNKKSSERMKNFYVEHPEVIERISKTLTGKKQSLETVTKRIAKTTGQKRTLEMRQRMSESRKGAVYSEETIENMKIAAKKRMRDPKIYEKVVSSLRKIAEKRKGVPLPESTKKKLSISHTGKKQTEEQRKKNGDRQRGVKKAPRTKTHCENISKAQKKRFEDPIERKKNSDRQLGELNHMFGKHHTPETCEIIRNKNKGKNSYMWKGGKSYFPYCPKFNRKFKDNVRRRFDYKCVFPGCGITQEETGRKHDVHHVSVEKMACCEGNIKEMDEVRKRLPKTVAKFGESDFTELEIVYIRMMVPLCKSHHVIVGRNEPDDIPYEDTVYRKYFAELIMNEYDGKCWDNGEA